MTNSGRVFDDDLSAIPSSKTSLTQAEENARIAYTEMIEILHLRYTTERRDSHPVARTKEEVLQQRVVAPTLVT